MCEDNVHKSQKNGQKLLLTEIWASSCHDILNKGYSEEECMCTICFDRSIENTSIFTCTAIVI